MTEIKCPDCGHVFAADEAEYTAIAKQIRDNEFEKELSNWKEQFEKTKVDAVKLALSDEKNRHQAILAEKDSLIAELKSEGNIVLANHKNDIEKLNRTHAEEIESWKHEVEKLRLASETSIVEATSKKEAELAELEYFL